MVIYFLCCFLGGFVVFWGYGYLLRLIYVFFLGVFIGSGSYESIIFERTVGKVVVGNVVS